MEILWGSGKGEIWLERGAMGLRRGKWGQIREMEVSEGGIGVKERGLGGFGVSGTREKRRWRKLKTI